MAKKPPTTKELLKRIDKRLDTMNSRLKRIEDEERVIEQGEADELDELKKLEALEEEIKKDVTPRPLTRITYHDFTKGVIGAFFGIVGHFAFFYGARIAESISLVRAHALLATSFILLIMFFYFTGFKKVSHKKGLFMPWRVLVIYLTAHVVIAFVLFLFGMIDVGMSAAEVYKNVASVSILAVMGAATADLLGAEE